LPSLSSTVCIRKLCGHRNSESHPIHVFRLLTCRVPLAGVVSCRQHPLLHALLRDGSAGAAAGPGALLLLQQPVQHGRSWAAVAARNSSSSLSVRDCPDGTGANENSSSRAAGSQNLAPLLPPAAAAAAKHSEEQQQQQRSSSSRSSRSSAVRSSKIVTAGWIVSGRCH